MLKKLSLLFIVIILNIFLINITNVKAQGAVNTISSGSLSNTCPTIITYDPSTGIYKEQSVSNFYGNNAVGIASNKANNPDNTVYYVFINGNQYKETRSSFLNSFGNNLSKLQCPPRITDLQTLFLRILVIVNSIIGLVLFYVIAKAGIIRMTSRGNPDAIKKSTGMIVNAIIGLLIVIVAYTALVLLGTRLMAPDNCTRFSFIESGRILFSFDQSDISPTIVTDGSIVGCSTDPINTTPKQ